MAIELSKKLTKERLRKAKEYGFSDYQLSSIFSTTEEEIKKLRIAYNLIPVYKTVDTCAAEFETTTPYFYSSFEEENESHPTKKKKIIILGSGPNRIGQGIEFDYCCVQASMSFQAKGYEAIMINCNPETVSTDYDISSKLYFEPLAFEDVMNIIELEKPDGVVISFGGQTPLKLSTLLSKAGVKIMGTDSANIDIAEDRKKFGAFIQKLSIPIPKFGTATNKEDAVRIANDIGYPVLIRPSYVLGGRAMKIIYNDESLHEYLTRAFDVSESKPLLIDSFLEKASEYDIDAVSDGKDCVVVGIMKHIEAAGIHSGDSTSVLPPIDVPKKIIAQIKKHTRTIAKNMKVIGLMNIQFAVQNDQVYVLEVNPRASRTVPFVCKATGIPMVKIACHLMLGEKISDLKKKFPLLVDCDELELDHICVKAPVFPFSRFLKQGVHLGPEMRSTGEVMSFAKAENFGEAFFKSVLSAGNSLPTSGSILVSLNNSDKTDETISVFRELYDIGFDFIGTKGTASFLIENGIGCKTVYKYGEGHPDVTDVIRLQRVQFVINTPEGEKSRFDEVAIGTSVIETKVPYVTTMEAAKASLAGIKHRRQKDFAIVSLQEYLKKVKSKK